MSACLTCGHKILVHYPNNQPCITPGCTCPKFDPATDHPTAVAGPTPDLQQAIHAAATALYKSSDETAELQGWNLIARIAVEAAWPYATGSANQHHWKRTAVNKMEQLQAAQAEVERLREVLDELWMVATDRGPLPKPVFDRVRAALDLAAQRKDPQ
jgi:hypothetical protein